jgi:hypothetical protein
MENGSLSIEQGKIVQPGRGASPSSLIPKLSIELSSNLFEIEIITLAQLAEILEIVFIISTTSKVTPLRKTA